ncbi:DUF1015 domain-containing protein [Candidatus Endomicrobiellum devescovinae]|jgi:uncharacterized protein (DUF1015 family)|uniref:DUF1015 domain-containing protein n=1 Tax=Candidatus Endomicrobiellum devescovinae TaxID=3242322 RepID=UPI00282A5CEC|nr:DUF1015 domain-containing protein [Endomicrobium sp.]
MADIKPFRAIRYSEENITNFICPPYDVISPSEKERLQKLSQFNIVNIELPDQTNKNNKYRNAAELLHLWQDEGVLVRDDIPAFYFYEQVFNDHGIKMTRRGFFAALKLENPHSQKGSIKPHEKTLSKPKADRLSLLKATKANISPIFGLFDDERHIIVDICKKIAKRNPSAVAKDKDGVFHKLWTVDDKDIIKTLEKYLLNKKIFIADGHHRYETAWNYSQERKEKDKHYSQYSDYNYVMSYLCPMEDPGISIWATHRVIEAPDNLESNIEKYFDVHLAKDFQKLSKKEIQPIMIFKDGKYRVLTIKKDDFLKKAMPKKSKAYRNLAVSALHYVLMPNIEASEFTYVKDDKEAVLLARKTGRMVIIVPPTPVQSLKAISLSNETMPQKSTYFYPKLASGIVIASVK